ncbi:hypothetical protein GCM10023078_29040 [Gibbsiella greigii]
MCRTSPSVRRYTAPGAQHYGALITRDSEVIDNVLAIDTVGSTVAPLHEAILALMDEIESLKARLEKYKSMAG